MFNKINDLRHAPKPLINAYGRAIFGGELGYRVSPTMPYNTFQRA